MSIEIEKLRAQGHNVEWYDRSRRKRPPKTEEPHACSRFSLYLLKGGYSYTVESNGNAYKSWKKLKTPAEQTRYFCSGCKAYWDKWTDALEHIEVKK